MIEKKVMLIINPRSGRNKARNGIIDLASVFGSNGYIASVFTTTGIGDATQYALKYAADYDLVVCRGGDGTFSEMLNGLMQLDSIPPVGFIPAGTTNDLAATLELPLNAKLAANIVLGNRYFYNDIGRFGNSRYFTYCAVFGAVSESSYATPQNIKNKIGRLAYFYEATKEIKKIKPIPLRVECDDFTEEAEYVMGSVTNSYSVGKIIKFSEKEVTLNDGLFEVFLSRDPVTVTAWKDLLYSVAVRKFDKRYIRVIKTKHVKITPLDGREIPWSLDGEFGGNNGVVDISVIQKAYRIFSNKTTGIN